MSRNTSSNITLSCVGRTASCPGRLSNMFGLSYHWFSASAVASATSGGAMATPYLSCIYDFISLAPSFLHRLSDAVPGRGCPGLSSGDTAGGGTA